MSQENVEIVRRNYEAFGRGDVDAAFEDFAPDFELDMSRAIGIDRGMYNLAQFRRLTESFLETWESVQLMADELIDAGEHVVMPFTNRQRAGTESRCSLAAPGCARSATGLIVRICLYQELPAAG